MALYLGSSKKSMFVLTGDSGLAFAEGESAGFEKGYAAGIAEGGYEEGYVDGKQAEYDAFWDGYQDNGNRTEYSSAFRGKGWTDQTFKPKYDLMPSTCSEMFRGSGVVDVVGALERTGITFDTSNATSLAHTFANTAIEEAPHLDLTKASDFSYLFNNCQKLKKASLTMAQGIIYEYKYMFSGCGSLEDLNINGVISVEISLANSPNLTSESVQSVIDALMDLNGYAAQTIKFHSTVLGKLTDDQINTIVTKNWNF